MRMRVHAERIFSERGGECPAVSRAFPVTRILAIIGAAIVLLPPMASAQLDVVITRSTQRAMPIAVVPLEWRVPLMAPVDLARIVEVAEFPRGAARRGPSNRGCGL